MGLDDSRSNNLMQLRFEGCQLRRMIEIQKGVLEINHVHFNHGMPRHPLLDSPATLIQIVSQVWAQLGRDQGMQWMVPGLIDGDSDGKG